MPEWLTIFLALGGSALISAVVVFFTNRALKKMLAKKDKKEEEEKKKEEKDREDLETYRHQQERVEQYNDIKALFKPVEDKIDIIDAKLTATSQGTLASLRSDILSAYYKCCEKGYRNDYDYQNIHDLYDAYLELHGNSFICDVMKRFDQLPSKENVYPVKSKKKNNIEEDKK